MFMESHYLVYPDGDNQEIDGPVAFNALVGMNGEALRLPLPSSRMIVYRVYKVRREESRGERTSFYHLELVRGEELFSLTR
jgi:hypothetical protein